MRFSLRLLAGAVRHRKKTLTLLIAACFLAAVALYKVFEARNVWRDARAQVADAAFIRFETQVQSPASAAMDALPGPAQFRDAVLFGGGIFIAGAGGVFQYSLTGDLQHSWLAGSDLPPYPAIAMAAGSLAGETRPKLWVATTGGLLSFDGAAWTQMTLPEHYNRIAALLLLPGGRLLFTAGDKGLFAFNGATITAYADRLRDVPITALAGSDGDLWIGTRDRGLLHYRSGVVEEFRESSGLPDDRILAIVTDGDRAFAGTPLGVAEFRHGRFDRILAEGVFSNELGLDGSTLTIGSIDEGVFAIDLTAARPSAPQAGPENLRVARFVHLDHTRFALTAEGLFETSHGGSWLRRIAAPGDLSDRNVSALALGRDGDLWIGYFNHGIDIVTAGRVRRHIEDEHTFAVNRIVYDPQSGGCYAAAANGLTLYSPDGRALRYYSRSDGLIANQITDVAIRPSGIAVATAAGITLMDGADIQSLYAFQGLVNNHVYALGVNGSRVLAGTLGGLSMIENGLVRASFTTANSGLKHNWISAMAPLGVDWLVGTYGAGVLRLQPSGEWSEYPDMPAHTVINANAMLSANGRALAGTLDRGLLTFDTADGRWSQITRGLPSLSVTAVAAAGDTLYIGTDNGLVSTRMEHIQLK